MFLDQIKFWRWRGNPCFLFFLWRCSGERWPCAQSYIKIKKLQFRMLIYGIIKVCKRRNASFVTLPLSSSVKLVHFSNRYLLQLQTTGNNSCCYVKQLINFYILVRGITWNPKLPRGIIRSHRTDRSPRPLEDASRLENVNLEAQKGAQTSGQ